MSLPDQSWRGVHTCHDACPCQAGGRPIPDFVEVDGMDTFERWECPEHGATQLQFRGPLDTPRVRVCPCGKEAVYVKYVRAATDSGAVDPCREALRLIAEHARLDLAERGIAEAERYAVIAEDALRATATERGAVGTDASGAPDAASVPDQNSRAADEEDAR